MVLTVPMPITTPICHDIRHTTIGLNINNPKLYPNFGK